MPVSCRRFHPEIQTHFDTFHLPGPGMQYAVVCEHANDIAEMVLLIVILFVFVFVFRSICFFML
jgi:hypothetical protein